jgi:O-methyltransferase domain/Dimerisation domain
MATKIVSAAVELGIADILGEASLTVEEVIRKTGTHGPSLRRLLRALVGLGVVEENGPGHYALTEFGRLLRLDVPGSVGRLMMARCAPEFWRSWGELVGSIRTGQSGWALAHGMPWLDYYQDHPDQWAVFNAHMGQHTRDVAPGIIEAYDFARFQTIVDVGGGDGTLTAEILRAHPGLQGVAFDLPQVVSSAPAVLAEAGVGDRADTIAGDFFASVPEGADAYLTGADRRAGHSRTGHSGRCPGPPVRHLHAGRDRREGTDHLGVPSPALLRRSHPQRAHRTTSPVRLPNDRGLPVMVASRRRLRHLPSALRASRRPRISPFTGTGHDLHLVPERRRRFRVVRQVGGGTECRPKRPAGLTAAGRG